MDWQQLVDKVARTPLSQILIFALVLTVYRVVVYKFLRDTPLHKRTGSYSFISGISEFCDALIYAAVFIFMVIRPYFFQTFQIPSGSMVPTLMVGDFIGLNKAIYRYTEPKRGDIVVFRPPARACTPEQLDADGTVKVDFVKRLIGLPGETIEIKMGNVYVDGKPLYEPYKHYTVTDQRQVDFKILEGAERDNIIKPNWKLVEYNGKLIPLNYTEFDANAFGRGYNIATDYRIDDPAEWPKARALPAQKIPAGYYLFMGDNRNGSYDGRGWGLVPRQSVVGRAEFVWLPVRRVGKISHVSNGNEKAADSVVPEFLSK